MVWSDLFMWGSWFNSNNFYTEARTAGMLYSYIDFWIFSICTFNSIFCTWI
jgi:hypothetical protein